MKQYSFEGTKLIGYQDHATQYYGHVSDEATDETEITIIMPKYLRSFVLSALISVIGILVLIITTVPASAQGTSCYGDAIFSFSLGIAAYDSGDYAMSAEMIQCTIDKISPEVVAQTENYAHLYYFLGRAQLAMGDEHDALESFTTYMGLTDTELPAEFAAFVDSHLNRNDSWLFPTI